MYISSVDTCRTDIWTERNYYLHDLMATRDPNDDGGGGGGEMKGGSSDDITMWLSWNKRKRGFRVDERRGVSQVASWASSDPPSTESIIPFSFHACCAHSSECVIACNISFQAHTRTNGIHLKRGKSGMRLKIRQRELSSPQMSCSPFRRIALALNYNTFIKFTFNSAWNELWSE